MATDGDGVYKRKDRKGYFLQWTGPDGKRCYAKATSDYLDAAREERSLYRRGEHPNQIAARTLRIENTFAQATDKFLAHQLPRLTPKAYEREAGITAHLKVFFAGKLMDVTASRVSDYLTVRLSKVSKSTVKKELTTLKHLFTLCYDEWEFLPEAHPNPTRRIKAPKFKDERSQHLTPKQFHRVLEASPTKMRAIFALLTATGMRRSELLGCKWKYVDETRILLPTSKNDEPKEIHLNTFAQKVLASIPKGGPDDLLFPEATAEAVSMAFHRVCNIIGISDIRLHDLRHTFATWLRQGGTELDVIASQLGHRDLRMTKRYARIASVQVMKAVKGLDAVLGNSRRALSPATRYHSATEAKRAIQRKSLNA